MSIPTSIKDKAEALNAGLTDTVETLIREAEPLLHHATDRVRECVNDLTQQGLDAASQSKQDMEQAGQHLKTRAACMIRHEPFKAMLIAAGLGAAAAALVSLMTRPKAR